MSWATIFDLLMHEYGVGLAELDKDWTPGRTLLYLRKMAERYQRQKDRRNGKKVISESELAASGFAQG